MTPHLNKRQRAFADAWNGYGTGVAAARAAGYRGSAKVLQVTAAKLLKHPGVIARIEERLGRPIAELLKPPASGPELEPPPVPTGSPLVKGRGRGTATERIEIAMKIARSSKSADRDRLAALRLAAELEQELRPVRSRVAAPAAIAAPLPPPSPARPPRLALVLSDTDQELARE